MTKSTHSPIPIAESRRRAMARRITAARPALFALIGGLALVLAVWILRVPGRSQRAVPAASLAAQPGRTLPAGGAGAGTAAPAAAALPTDPNLPLYVGASRRLAADAIDAIARSGLDSALVQLGQRFLGSTALPLPPGSVPREHLQLDLTGFDNLSFVEQLLALANSRQVRTRTEATDRFSDHVRQLRYGGGRVDRCARLRQPSLWAVAAQRRGYLVDLTPYLPGARRQPVALRELLQDPTAAAASTATQPCRLLPRTRALLPLAELPLRALPAALPSLHSGDLIVLRGPATDRSADGVGVVELRGGRPGALLLQPGRGVVRVEDLSALARSWPGIRGVAFLRPLPNQDGKPAS